MVRDPVFTVVVANTAMRNIDVSESEENCNGLSALSSS